MYSLQEIKSALDRETLSDALYKMERFARANSVNDLADWCKLELHGYDPVHKEERERVTELRSVAVQWRDVFNHPVIIDPQLSFFSTLLDIGENRRLKSAFLAAIFAFDDKVSESEKAGNSS